MSCTLPQGKSRKLKTKPESRLGPGSQRREPSRGGQGPGLQAARPAAKGSRPEPCGLPGPLWTRHTDKDQSEQPPPSGAPAAGRRGFLGGLRSGSEAPAGSRKSWAMQAWTGHREEDKEESGQSGGGRGHRWNVCLGTPPRLHQGEAQRRRPWEAMVGPRCWPASRGCPASLGRKVPGFEVSRWPSGRAGRCSHLCLLQSTAESGCQLPGARGRAGEGALPEVALRRSVPSGEGPSVLPCGAAGGTLFSL